VPIETRQKTIPYGTRRPPIKGRKSLNFARQPTEEINGSRDRGRVDISQAEKRAAAQMID